MSNGGLERAERRMGPGDGGVALQPGVGRMGLIKGGVNGKKLV